MAFTRPKAAQIDFDVTNITDPLIRLNSGQSGTNNKDIGLVIERGSDTNVALIWDESTDSFAVINTSEDGSTSGDVTISSYADLTLKKITQSEQQYTTSNMMKFNQRYTGASAGSYFTQNEYQKILTIVPDGDSQNYQISGRMMAQSAGSIQIVTFNAALRSNTLPDLDWSITYTDQHNGIAFVKPQLWTKETTTAGFIVAFQYIHNSNLYGSVTVDIDVIPRADSQKANVTMNTTINSETTSVESGYTANDMTKIMEINGDDIDISAHDGSADGLKLGGTLVTATAAELNYVDGVTSNIQTQIDNISSSFTLSADSGSNDTFTTGETLTIAGGTGIDTTVSDNNISIAIDSTVTTLTGSQTLTNKTLTSPTITGTGAIAGTFTGNITGDVTGNADTATALATARNIAGQSFDGTANITIASTDLSDTSNLVRNNQNNTITSTTAGSSAAPEFELFRDITGADSNYIGQIKFSADNDANSKTVFAKITGKIGDASDGTEDGIIEIAHIKAGSQNINVRMTSTEFKILNGTDFDIETHDGSSAGLRLNNTLVTSTAAELNILDGVTATASELNIIDGDTSATSTTLADADRVVVNDAGTMKQVALTDFETYFETALDTLSNVTSVGTLNGLAVASTQTVTMGANRLQNVADPVGNQDAATKAYVDANAGSGGGSSGFTASTTTTAPGSDGDFDLSFNVAQTTQETPFESGGSDAFGVSLGEVYDQMEPVGSTSSVDLGVLT